MQMGGAKDEGGEKRRDGVAERWRGRGFTDETVVQCNVTGLVNRERIQERIHEHYILLSRTAHSGSLMMSMNLRCLEDCEDVSEFFSIVSSIKRVEALTW